MSSAFDGVYYGKPTRTESIVITVGLNKNQYEQVKEHATTIIGMASGEAYDLGEGDTLNLKYSFFIHYFNRCNEALAAMTELLKCEGAVKRVDMEELIHGECVIKELLDRIQKFKEYAR